MGILGSSASVTRYRLVDPPTPALLTEIPARLRKFGFQDIDETSDEKSIGFVNLDDFLDAKWRKSPPEKADYFAFSLRMDTRRISPAVYKKHLRMELEKAEDEVKRQGRKFLSKEQKTNIKDAVRGRLLSRALPIPAVFDVVWNIPKHMIYLATTNGKVKEVFQTIFTDAFDLHLEPVTPYFLALSIVGESAQHRLDAVEPALFAKGAA